MRAVPTIIMPWQQTPSLQASSLLMADIGKDRERFQRGARPVRLSKSRARPPCPVRCRTGVHHREHDATALGESLKREALENRKNETRLKLAVESAGLVAWHWDLKCGPDGHGSEFSGNLGLESLASAADSFPLVHAEDRQRHEAVVLGAVRAKRMYESEFRIVRPDSGARKHSTGLIPTS